MKIRSGFVSNSSSSSFVVLYRKEDMSGGKSKHKFFIDKDTVKKMKDFGFKWTKANNPYFLGTSITPFIPFKEFRRFDDVYLGMDVTCNQDDVIYFLLNNKIPFVALCEYEQELVVWDGKTKYFYKMQNIVETVSRDNGKVSHDVGETSQYIPTQLCPNVQKIKINEWLDKERAYVSSLV